jgi:hypothetical protein
MEDYKLAINKQEIIEQDERVKKELYYFIYNDQMREEAQVGYHDDGVMTDAICFQMRKHPLIEF